MTLTTYPLDDYDYRADDAALFHCTRTSGIYAQEDFSFSVSGADNIITLGPGIAWMRINRFKGLVAAMKNETSVDLGLPDSVYPRIDRVVLQFNANKNCTEVVVKQGTAASNPIPPERSTSEALFELHLIEVRREPGAVSVTAANATDLRLDKNYCGLMADSVTSVDTTAISRQVTDLIQNLRDEINNVKAGTAFVLKSGDVMTGNLGMSGSKITGLGTPTDAGDGASKAYVDGKHILATVSLPAASWAGEAAPYTQTVAVEGILATDTPHYGIVYSGTAEEKAAQKEGFALVDDLDPGLDSVMFTCLEEKPEADLTVQLEVNR